LITRARKLLVKAPSYGMTPLESSAEYKLIFQQCKES